MEGYCGAEEGGDGRVNLEKRLVTVFSSQRVFVCLCVLLGGCYSGMFNFFALGLG